MFVQYNDPKHTRGAGPNRRPTTYSADFEPVGPRYTDLKFLALGGYGVLASAVDTQAVLSPPPNPGENEDEASANANKVAVKKITLLESEKFHVLILREIRILSRLQHENIIDIRDMMLARTRPTCETVEAASITQPIERSIFILQSLMDFDLHAAIRQPDGLTAEHICCFVYQILRGLKYIHSAKVVHRDLKPNNILLNRQCELKICDFGQSRMVDAEICASHGMTEYVVTRWYRAPEIMTNPRSYTQAVDLWSVGCIFVEMLSSRPLFPGTTPTDQLTQIIRVLGTPSQDQLKATITCESARKFVNELPRTEKRSWQSIVGAHREALDEHAPGLLDKLLTFDPAKRIKADEALQDLYVEKWHDPTDEPVCTETIVFEPKIDEFNVQQLEQLLTAEVDNFQHKQLALQSDEELSAKLA